MAFPSAHVFSTPLGHHRLLSPTAGLKVSPLCLGAMNFGTAWTAHMGECSKETAFEILDTFYESGGNFVDTANNYQAGQSEEWIGEWMELRGIRDQMVVATKYTNSFALGKIQSNFGGNGNKSLQLSVAASLKKLRTTYIDILYVHYYDFTTSIPELMHSLNTLLLSGKVLYLGISDAPAWIVSQANEYARQNGLRPFVVYQGLWSAAQRDFERDIIPMCVHEGMALAPWGALGGGNFKTRAQLENKSTSGGRNIPTLVTQGHALVSGVLENIAVEKGTGLTSVALAYVMHKAPYVFPLVGGRKVEHLKANIEALKLRLTQEEIKEIEGAVEFDIGFPQSLLGGEGGVRGPGDIGLTRNLGSFDWVEAPKPIMPRE